MSDGGKRDRAESYEYESGDGAWSRHVVERGDGAGIGSLRGDRAGFGASALYFIYLGHFFFVLKNHLFLFATKSRSLTKSTN